MTAWDGECSAVPSTFRAGDSDSEVGHKTKIHEGSIGMKAHQYITVKGVVLSSRQMKGIEDTKKTTSTKKVKKTGAVKKTTTTTPSSNNILNYCEFNKEDIC